MDLKELLTSQSRSPKTPAVRWADTLLAGVYITCFIVGIPGNLVAMKYFIKEQKLSSYLFLATAMVDIVGLAVKCVPISISLLHHRSEVLYSSDIACHIIGMLQNATIMASVFIVAVLSSTRTYSLVFPLSRVRRTAVMAFMASYFVILVLHETVPVLAGGLTFNYNNEDVICWDSGHWSVYDDIIDSLFLALPIIPITICCVVSCHQVYFTVTPTALTSRSDGGCHGNRLKSSATITIILYTITYIIFNIPNFINYILWNITSIAYSWPGPLYSTMFMQYYSWNISGELCLVLNSLVNPLIYLFRIRRYRAWVKERGIRLSVVLINENLVFTRNSQGNIRTDTECCTSIAKQTAKASDMIGG